MEISMNTNDATRANAQALPEISDLLRRAIERHDAAYAYFSATVYLSDDGILGRVATVDEQAIYSAASDAEKTALSDVCYFPALTAADMAAKARHLRKYHSFRYDYLEGWQVENLLRSMLPEAERDQLDDDETETKPADLSSLIAAHAEATALVNEYEGGNDDPKIGEHCDKQISLALAICGYRASTDEERLRKAQFLRDWTRDTHLTEEEQHALIASMLPEGSEA
jgi:hypothetical protein